MTDDVATGSTPTAKRSLTPSFLEASGYKPSDILSQNDRTRIFVTSNGGKYQLMKSGKVRRISGPAYPKEKAEE